MPPASTLPFGPRLTRLRDDLRDEALDAFVVTNLVNLRYLTGFSGTAGAAIVTPAHSVLVVDFRYVTDARELIAARADGSLELVTAVGGYDDALVAVLGRLGALRIGFEAASVTVSRFNRLSAMLASRAATRDTVRMEPETVRLKPPFDEAQGGPEFIEGPDPTDATPPVLVPTERLVEGRRAVKDEVEIATLREAARRLSGVARQVRAFVRVGRSEQAVAADIDAAIRGAGFERPAFDTIVASGPNTARPHARPGGRTLEAGEGVVLDFGGVYDGYCVDLTRTLHLGAPAPELRRIHVAVGEAHAAAIAAVRPGARPSEIDAAARGVLARHGLGDAFGHGTGHGLGLEVHEAPWITRLPAAQPDAPVVSGMVFTIEPGAYVEGLGGVRIEDDVLVVDGGCEVLTGVPIDL